MADPADGVADLIARVGWLPPWAQSLLLLLLAIGVALGVHAIGVVVVRRVLTRRDAFWRSLVLRTQGPGRLTLITIALSAANQAAPLTPSAASLLRHALLICLIFLLGWICLVALDIGAALYVRGFKTDTEDNLLARKHLTQVRILRQAAAVLVALVTVGFALTTVDAVRQWGVSLLAAGGAASIVVGLALQPLLTNLIAGIQIAITQPIRLDDAVIVENEWGWIEEINVAFVVVRLWDWRRMVLPLSYFIQHPFQNWTRESSALIGTAMIYVDFAAPVEALRARLEEIAKASPLWDGRVVNLAVTDLRERVMEVRCLVSARNAGQTFDLRCEVREKMLAFLKAEHPGALPRERLVFEPEWPVSARAGDGAAARTRPSSNEAREQPAPRPGS
jgi:small-conductance mechanosensitive channel